MKVRPSIKPIHTNTAKLFVVMVVLWLLPTSQKHKQRQGNQKGENMKQYCGIDIPNDERVRVVSLTYVYVGGYGIQRIQPSCCWGFTEDVRCKRLDT